MVGVFAGTGNALDFGDQIAAGTYTVVATNKVSGCTDNMNDSAIVIINTGTFNAYTETGCYYYYWNGNYYENSGTYTYDYNNNTGCASTDTLHLTIWTAPVVSSTDSLITSCPGDKYVS